MKNCLRLINGHSKNRLAITLLGLSLLFVQPAAAVDLQCNLAKNSQIKPAILSTMMEAADKGELYYVDATTSDIAFQVNHFPFSTVKGRFEQFQGGLALPSRTHNSNQALFVIKVDSVATGDSALDDYLKSAVFFNVMQFPDIIFVSTGFEWINSTTARLHGELTLHGTTRPLAFDVQLDAAENSAVNTGQKMTMLASAEIQRSEFGMHELPLLVSDTVRFNLKIEASKQISQGQKVKTGG